MWSKTIKKASIVLILLVFVRSAAAQNDQQFTQFMFNRLSYNPAYAGSSGSLCGTLLYRNQWLGLKLDSPETGGKAGKTPADYLFSFDAPVKAFHGGIGLGMVHETVGYRTNTSVNLDYAFRMFWGPGNMAAAIEADLTSTGLMKDELYGSSDLSGDPTQHASGSSDPLLQRGDSSDFLFDLSTGIYYQVPGQYYFGVSVKNLLGAHSNKINYELARTLYVMGGFDYVLPFNPSFKLKPSALIKVADFSNFQLDVACLLDYRNTIWGGVSYRFQDAFAIWGGVNFWKHLQFGAAYDFTLSRIGGYKPGRSWGSVELYLRYCFKIPHPVKDPTIYQNSRYTDN